jgi:hypothetical protein
VVGDFTTLATILFDRDGVFRATFVMMVVLVGDELLETPPPPIEGLSPIVNLIFIFIYYFILLCFRRFVDIQ